MLSRLGFLQDKGDNVIAGQDTDTGSHVHPENNQACGDTKKNPALVSRQLCLPLSGDLSFGCAPMCVGTHVWVCSCAGECEGNLRCQSSLIVHFGFGMGLSLAWNLPCLLPLASLALGL